MVRARESEPKAAADQPKYASEDIDKPQGQPAYTAEDIEEDPRLLERGPVEPKKEAVNPATVTTVIIDGQVIEVVDAKSADDAVSQAQKAVKAKPKRKSR